MSDNDRIASRDIPATIIPYGDPVIIPEGSRLTITHRLGGNFTVLWERGMARVEGKDAEAIGEEATATPPDPSPDSSGPVTEEGVWEALKLVFDPEIPVNIVDLGLVYNLTIDNADSGNATVHVDMTLTAPGCGMGPAIASDAKHRVQQIAGVGEAHVELVWDPPWHQDMISEVGKMELGLL